MKFVLSLIASLFFLVGCRDDPPADNAYVLSYVGTYMWRDPDVVIIAAKIDSVEFTITDGVLYSLQFHRLDPTDRVDFCDCSGNLSKNTSAVITFEPTTISYAACDTLRIPRGDFTPDYVSHSPDTVYFEKSDDTSLYRFVVIER